MALPSPEFVVRCVHATTADGRSLSTPMPEPSNAAKAVIVHDGRCLLIRRRPNDVHRPAEWDIPGGRLARGEDPFTGLQRETREETGLDVEVEFPLDVHHFTRQDGQVITMMIFACRPTTTDVVLSEEHTEYRWISVDADPSEFPEWMRSMVTRYRQWARVPA